MPDHSKARFLSGFRMVGHLAFGRHFVFYHLKAGPDFFFG
jgi:hypothetical protein